MLEKELENSYEKEDYENLSEFRGIKIFKSDEDFYWSEV